MTSHWASPRRLAGRPRASAAGTPGSRTRPSPRLEVLAAGEDRRLPGLGVAHDHDARELIAAVVVELFPDAVEPRRGRAASRRASGGPCRRSACAVPLRASSSRRRCARPRACAGWPPARPAGPSRRRACRRRRSPAASPRRRDSAASFRLGLGRLHLRFELGDPRLVLLGRELDERRRDADPRREELGRAALRDAVEGVEQAVVVLLGDRVILVIVTLGARHRQAEPGRGGGVDPVEQVHEPLLLGDRAAFAVQEVIAVEPAGDLVLGRGPGQEVAGQEPDGELIERHVVVQGLDQPVAPDPLPGVAVLLEAVAVGVAGGIEPGQGHPLAVMRAREQAVDEASRTPPGRCRRRTHRPPRASAAAPSGRSRAA